MPVYILEQGINPSSDYYIIPVFSLNGYSVVRIDIRRDKFPEIEEGSTVCIVRYLNKKVLKFLKENRNRIGRLIYFMDDGLWDIKALLSLPPAYAIRIFKGAYIYRRAVIKLGAELWVSTDYLARKYKNYNPKIIYPYPLGLEEVSLSESKTNLIFYHGTSSHRKEISWLSSLAKSINKAFPDVLMEVVLDRKNKKHFAGVKNLLSLRPMNWETFYRFSSLRYRTVGLVPLFDEEFNRGRSWVKFYDITRSGAVGIYSEKVPYAEMIKKFRAGVVLPMEQGFWIEAIKELLTFEEKRAELFSGAKKLLNYLREKAEKSYREVLEHGKGDRET